MSNTLGSKRGPYNKSKRPVLTPGGVAAAPKAAKQTPAATANSDVRVVVNEELGAYSPKKYEIIRNYFKGNRGDIVWNRFPFLPQLGPTDAAFIPNGDENCDEKLMRTAIRQFLKEPQGSSKKFRVDKAYTDAENLDRQTGLLLIRTK